MTMKGARKIYRRELIEQPGLGIGLTGKLARICRGPARAAGVLVR